MRNADEIKALLAADYDVYDFLDLLELGPAELAELLTDYIEEHLEEINSRLQGDFWKDDRLQNKQRAKHREETW